jgi:hypothetical protein
MDAFALLKEFYSQSDRKNKNQFVNSSTLLL